MPETTRTIALIQMEIGPDPDRNLNEARERVEKAAQNGAQFICLPELFRTRYFPQQIGTPVQSLAETIPGESTDVFTRIAKEYKAVIIVPVFERSPLGHLENAAVVIDADGSLHAPYYKVHIPQDPKFFEKGYFYPGNHYAVHATRYGKIAVLICYDQWFPEAARCVSLEGAEIIFYPTAIGNPCTEQPSEGDWQEAWEIIQRSHAIANSVHIAAVNRAGGEGNIRFFGGSFICDAFGKVLARAGDANETITATADLELNESIRDSWGFFRNRRPDTYGAVCARVPEHDATAPIPRKGDTPRKLGYSMPAEWEPHEAVWLSWPHNKFTFPDLDRVEEAYIRFIAGIAPSERVELFVPTPMANRMVKARLRTAGVDLSRVTLRTIQYADVWIRDYGPTFVVNPALKRSAMVHWRFNAWGEKYPDQIADGHVPDDMNRWLGLPVFTPGIILEGGSIDTNGRGTVLTTQACLLNRNRNPELTKDEIEEYLKEYLGVVKILWLNRGVAGDDTDGHVDDIARFVSPTTIVCAYEENPKDENYAALNENYEILRAATDQEGNPFTIIKLPMPAPVMSEEDRCPASYTNFYIGNTVVIVPVFDDPQDKEALRILQELFPDRTVMGVNARAMVEGYGTFHCATQQQPRT
ncbi:Porphyromonas-type peptidyl-arginine deiminase [Methanoregula boonei 6A8]|uniref:Porphyromonas-type peptidyl-arginine deiminase n=1 Tax=Methanoregula boonei (strain DSM 21154 / JCM 14090 / 6A8) TaxID=456442 RepID=A7I5W9_METB6|nr:agmatine deiminase family protein [Methanoregula boonei]ABS55130.1 Porphyromonas-type peptidyl-arginine deiminase [Methanoregula boonei 6A8]